MQCWGWIHTPGLAHTLLRVAHSEWDTENGSSGKLAALRVSALPLQVTKLVFHEDGKMNLISSLLINRSVYLLEIKLTILG